MDVFVRKNAATVIREIVKHTPELAQLVVSSGGVGALVDVNEAKAITACRELWRLATFSVL